MRVHADSGRMGLKAIILGLCWFTLALIGASIAVSYLHDGSIEDGSLVVVLTSCVVALMTWVTAVDPVDRMRARARVRRRLARNEGTAEDLLSFLDERAKGRDRFCCGTLSVEEAELALPAVVRWVEGQWRGLSPWWRWQGPYRDVTGTDTGAVYRWLTAPARQRSQSSPLSLLLDCLDARIGGTDMDAHLHGDRPLDAAAVAVMASLRRPLTC